MNNRIQSGGLAMALLAGLGTNSGFGAVLSVTSTNDNDAGSLRQTISQAAPGDTLEFAVKGTITLTSGELFIAKNLTITGPGATNLLINGNAQSRVFHINSNITASISGVTITNGLAQSGTNSASSGGRAGDGAFGGGLLNEGTLNLASCVVVGNKGGVGGDDLHYYQSSGVIGGGGKGGSGGGLANFGSLFMDQCFVGNNVAGKGGQTADLSDLGANSVGYGGDGGGIYSTGSLVVTNSVISGNCSGEGNSILSSGGNGGGIYNSGGIRVIASYISDNATGSAGAATINPILNPSGTGGFGGGLYNQGILSLESSTLSSNRTGDGGVGGYWEFGFVVYTSFPGGLGGCGAGVYNAGTANLTNSTFSLNLCGNGGKGGLNNSGGQGGCGGGIFNLGTVNSINCTTVANSAGIGGNPTRYNVWADPAPGLPGDGGGIYTTTNTIRLLNTLIVGNTATTNLASSDVCGSFISLGHNLAGISTTNGFGVTGDIVGSTIAPVDAHVASLADNGGTTPTCALLAGSPAIDAGDDAVLSDPWNLTTDQRGFARKTGSHVDIGAFEFSNTRDVPLRLGTSLSLPNQSIRLDLSGNLGQHFDILVSPDLVHWTRLTTVTNDTGTVSLTQPLNGTSAVQFYRAQELP